jgi:hypothetical protein
MGWRIALKIEKSDNYGAAVLIGTTCGRDKNSAKASPAPFPKAGNVWQHGESQGVSHDV